MWCLIASILDLCPLSYFSGTDPQDQPERQLSLNRKKNTRLVQVLQGTLWCVPGEDTLSLLLSTGLEVIKLEFILRLKIKHNDWLPADTCLRLYSSFITSRPGLTQETILCASCRLRLIGKSLGLSLTKGIVCVLEKDIYPHC